MSRVLPILFNGEMVRAILDGRKTVTRRVAKKIPVETHRVEEDIDFDPFDDTEQQIFECHWGGYQPDTGCFVDGSCVVKPPYQPGDILYVRETWTHHENAVGGIIFKARCPEKLANAKKWRPSIHMPKEAARIWLKVTDVRVERLKDISNEQVLKEGISREAVSHYMGQVPEETEEWERAAYIIPYSELWDSTVKKSDLDRYGWDADPWVWVIEFERCEKPEAE